MHWRLGRYSSGRGVNVRNSQGQEKGLVPLWPFPLYEANFNPVRGWSQGKPERGRRSILDGRERPKNKKDRFAFLGGQMQTPQTFRPEMIAPKKQRTTAATTQDLLGRPQGIFRYLALDPKNISRFESQAGQGNRVRWMRRLDHHDFSMSHRSQGGRQQSQFPNPWLLNHQINQTARWPSPAR